MIRKITYATQRVKFSHVNENEELVTPSHIGAVVLVGTMHNGEFVVLWRDKPVPLPQLLQRFIGTQLDVDPSLMNGHLMEAGTQFSIFPGALLELMPSDRLRTDILPGWVADTTAELDEAEKAEAQQVPSTLADLVVLLGKAEAGEHLQVPAHIVETQPVLGVAEKGESDGAMPSAVETHPLIANSDAGESGGVSAAVSGADPKNAGVFDVKTSGTDTLVYSVAPVKADVQKVESRPQQLVVLVAEPCNPVGIFEESTDVQGAVGIVSLEKVPVIENTADGEVLAATVGDPDLVGVDKQRTADTTQPITVTTLSAADILEQAGAGSALLFTDGTVIQIPVQKARVDDIAATNVKAAPVFRDTLETDGAKPVVLVLRNESKYADTTDGANGGVAAVVSEGSPRIIGSVDYDSSGALFIRPDGELKAVETREFDTGQMTGLPLVILSRTPIATFSGQSGTLSLHSDAKLSMAPAQAEGCEEPVLYSLPIQIAFDTSGTLRVCGADTGAVIIALAHNQADAQKASNAVSLGAAMRFLHSLVPKLKIAPVSPSSMANAATKASLADALDERSEQTGSGVAVLDYSAVDALKAEEEDACGGCSKAEPQLRDILSSPLESAAGMSTGMSPGIKPSVESSNGGISVGVSDTEFSWYYEIDDLDTAHVTTIDALTINPLENDATDYHRSQLKAFDEYLVREDEQ